MIWSYQYDLLKRKLKISLKDIKGLKVETSYNTIIPQNILKKND